VGITSAGTGKTVFMPLRKPPIVFPGRLVEREYFDRVEAEIAETVFLRIFPFPERMGPHQSGIGEGIPQFREIYTLLYRPAAAIDQYVPAIGIYFLSCHDEEMCGNPCFFSELLQFIGLPLVVMLGKDYSLQSPLEDLLDQCYRLDPAAPGIAR
jgi:hypothetical protein